MIEQPIQYRGYTIHVDNEPYGAGKMVVMQDHGNNQATGDYYGCSTDDIHDEARRWVDETIKTEKRKLKACIRAVEKEKRESGANSRVLQGV